MSTPRIHRDDPCDGTEHDPREDQDPDRTADYGPGTDTHPGQDLLAQLLTLCSKGS